MGRPRRIRNDALCHRGRGILPLYLRRKRIALFEGSDHRLHEGEGRSLVTEQLIRYKKSRAQCVRLFLFARNAGSMHFNVFFMLKNARFELFSRIGSEFRHEFWEMLRQNRSYLIKNRAFRAVFTIILLFRKTLIKKPRMGAF